MDISIFGLGYVGCVSLGCLARNGHRCIGVDLNETKVSFINQGKATIFEREIKEEELEDLNSSSSSSETYQLS